MNCENEFCIYQCDGYCTLNHISIDHSGRCADCIYPNIDRKQLVQLKRKLLKKYKNTDKIFSVYLNPKNQFEQ